MSASLDQVNRSMLMSIWLQYAQVCHKKYEQQWTCTLVERVAVIPGASPSLWRSAAQQERYVHEKLDPRIASWFWRGPSRQEQPSGSNLVFLSAYVNHCCVGVGCVPRSVTIRLKICSQLVINYIFNFQNTSVVLLDFQPQSYPLCWSVVLQGRRPDKKYCCLTMKLCYVTSRILGVAFFHTIQGVPGGMDKTSGECSLC